MKRLLGLLALLVGVCFAGNVAVASDCGGVRCIAIYGGGGTPGYRCCEEHLEGTYCVQDYCWTSYGCNPELDPCIDQQF
jgi:hypothetical protein